MRGIEKLIPEAQEAAKEFEAACKAQGLNVLITDTLRTEAEQNALYAQGRTTAGNIVTSCRYPQSLHNWGTAFDFCRNERGREYVNTDGFFDKCGAVAESLGLVWGGHFKSSDRPHVQLAKYSTDKTAARLIRNYGAPERFIQERIKEAETLTQEDFKKLLRECITPETAREMVRLGIETLSKDTEPDEWAQDAMMWAKEQGIYQGDESGNLMPQKPVTRQELAQVLVNYESKAD